MKIPIPVTANSNTAWTCTDGALVGDSEQGSASNSDSESDDADVGANVSNTMKLRVPSRNLSGQHYTCPELIDLL